MMKEAERFQRAFEDAAIGIALLAVEPLGKYLEVNPTFCRMTGYLREELLARDFQSITVSQDIDKNLEQVKSLLRGSVPSLQLEKRYIRKNSSSFWARLNVSLVRDERKNPQYFIVQIEDIDERKQAEEALEIFRRERERVKLVVLDLTMPRMSGREVLKQFLRLDPKMRILISSGHQTPGDANQLQGLGMVEFVPKPYRPDDLARSVRKLLDAAIPRDPRQAS